jgi:KAP family P-loop domain
MNALNDNPIHDRQSDTLGRAESAEAFALHVLALDRSEGAVVGVLGPWGSGKTSYINLARDEFRTAGAEIVDFNPWMFSGAEQLVESFFVEVASQLKHRPGLADVGKDLEDYGELFSGLGWLPLVGPWIERGRIANKLLAKLLQRRKEGSVGRRAKLSKELQTFGRPIVVVIDDIDRLSTTEIRDIFKLVRLTASFPNIIYVLAFDRERVENALTEQGIQGRDYLEKILQLAIDLPTVASDVLTRQVLTAIDDAVAEADNRGPFDEERWPDVFMEVIRPLIRNMRDVRRYSAAVYGTVRALKGQIALVDVLALEAVRVFLPDTFKRIAGSVDALTTTLSLMYRSQDPPELKAAIDDMLDVPDDRKALLASLIERVFPAAHRHIPRGTYFGPDSESRWLRDRRVAQNDILRLYLERVAGEGLRAFAEAEQAWNIITDRDAFDAYLRSLPYTSRGDVIAKLAAYEQDFKVQHAVAGTAVLLNLIPDVPEEGGGMFRIEPNIVVGRITLRLLRAVGDPAAVAEAVRQILPHLTTLSAKFELITDVGFRESAGHKLVSEADAKGFKRQWRGEVRAATPNQLIVEWNLARVLYFANDDRPDDESPTVVPDDPDVTLAVLRSARTETRSQTVGARAVRRAPRLPWDMLVAIYGSDEILHERVDALEVAAGPEDGDLLALARKYRGGWRPKDFGGDNDEE